MSFLYVSVLGNGISISMSFLLPVLLSGKYMVYVMYLFAGIPTTPLCILNNMVNMFLSLLVTSVSHFKSDSIWMTLLQSVLLFFVSLPVCYLASVVWVPGT